MAGAAVGPEGAGRGEATCKSFARGTPFWDVPPPGAESPNPTTTQSIGRHCSMAGGAIGTEVYIWESDDYLSYNPYQYPCWGNCKFIP